MEKDSTVCDKIFERSREKYNNVFTTFLSWRLNYFTSISAGLSNPAITFDRDCELTLGKIRTLNKAGIVREKHSKQIDRGNYRKFVYLTTLQQNDNLLTIMII